MSAKERLDALMVKRKLAGDFSLAQRLVMAGQVRVAGQMVLKASMLVPSQAEIVVESGPRFASRGGDKLEAALQAFPVRIQDAVCADVGASTGGFTDCLLQHGASRVYAIDVGHGLLDWKLRQNPAVIVMEKTNARGIQRLPEPVQLVTIDASFISLKVLLPVVSNWFEPLSATAAPAQGVVALIKPQFEASRAEVSRGKGVIRDPLVHRRVLRNVLAFAQAQGMRVGGLLRSPLLGPKGNTEFLVWLHWKSAAAADVETLIAGVVPPANVETQP